MQKKDAALFRRILSRNFALREAEGKLYDQHAYIRDRVERQETVGSVRYENLVLQFFGDVAVLTYRNI